jgi:N-acetylglutamate synthase/N-acetylornithine aminotransferase
MMENSHPHQLTHPIHNHHHPTHHPNMFNSMNQSIHLQSVSKGSGAMNPNVITLLNSTNGSIPSLSDHSTGKEKYLDFKLN